MIHLREVKLEDSNELFEICSNPNMTKFLTWDYHKDINETMFVVSNFFLHNKSDRPNSFVIVENSTNPYKYI